MFSSFTTNQGGQTSAAFAPADLYDAYGSLRTYFAQPPYFLVMHPGQIWDTNGLIVLLDNSSDALQSMGVGSVGEDFARYGFSGMVMGFNIYADANISWTTETDTGCGAAFARSAIKNVRKRDFEIELQRQAEEVGVKIVGSEIRGEAVLRNKHGNEMQFPKY